MIPVPELLRPVVAALWDREFADGLARGRLAAESPEDHTTLLVERIAETVEALSAIDWDAAGR